MTVSRKFPRILETCNRNCDTERVSPSKIVNLSLLVKLRDFAALARVTLTADAAVGDLPAINNAAKEYACIDFVNANAPRSSLTHYTALPHANPFFSNNTPHKNSTATDAITNPVNTTYSLLFHQHHEAAVDCLGLDCFRHLLRSLCGGGMEKFVEVRRSVERSRSVSSTSTICTR